MAADIQRSKIKALMMAEWSYLPPELILCIAKRMDSLEEFIVVGTVCKSWRSATTKENYFSSHELRSKHQVPMLVLPQETAARTPRKVLSLTKDKIIELNLSEIDGKRCYSSLGWVLTLSKDLKFSLVHPLNHALIELPNGDGGFGIPLNGGCLSKFILSSSPSWTSDYTVIVIGIACFAFCRPGLNDGEKYWTVIKCSREFIYFRDIACYRGQYYVVDHKGRIYVFDTTQVFKQAELRAVSQGILKEIRGLRYFNTTRGFKQAELRAVSQGIPKEIRGLRHSAEYLVESGGELLLVLFFGLRKGCYKTIGCRVFKLIFGNNSCLDKLEEVKSLGNRSLFLGKTSSSFSVEASGSGSQWKPNCIYFMNNALLGHFPNDDGTFSNINVDMGIFHMDDGHIERPVADFLNKASFFGGLMDTLNFWVEPSF